jgi:Na+-driven multidrug efflux pump
MNIALTVDNLALVFFIGIANACAILVGNWIGRGDELRAYKYASQTLGLGMASAVLIGVLIATGSGIILQFYKVAPIVIWYARAILYVIAILLWVRMTNLILFVGVFRSGGDTRFAFILDVGSIWVIGVPMAFLGAFIFHLPVYLVYLMALSEEVFKCFIGLKRMFSRRWINNLTYLAIHADTPLEPGYEPK